MTELTIFLLLACKHAIADLALQARLVGKGEKTNLRTPRLWIHCADHAVLTFAVLIFFVNIKIALLLTLLDFVFHFIIDYTKNRIQLYTGVTLKHRQYWNYAAVDQILHYLTYFLIAFLILTWV